MIYTTHSNPGYFASMYRILGRSNLRMIMNSGDSSVSHVPVNR